MQALGQRPRALHARTSRAASCSTPSRPPSRRARRRRRRRPPTSTSCSASTRRRPRSPSGCASTSPSRRTRPQRRRARHAHPPRRQQPLARGAEPGRPTSTSSCPSGRATDTNAAARRRLAGARLRPGGHRAARPAAGPADHRLQARPPRRRGPRVRAGRRRRSAGAPPAAATASSVAPRSTTARAGRRTSPASRPCSPASPPTRPSCCCRATSTTAARSASTTGPQRATRRASCSARRARRRTSFKAQVEEIARQDGNLQRAEEVPVERLAWNEIDVDRPRRRPVPALPLARRARLRSAAGARAERGRGRRAPRSPPTKPPDWRWRLLAVVDTTTDARRPAGRDPPGRRPARRPTDDEPAATGPRRGHLHQTRVTEGKPMLRRIVFDPNFGTVQFARNRRRPPRRAPHPHDRRRSSRSTLSRRTSRCRPAAHPSRTVTFGPHTVHRARCARRPTRRHPTLVTDRWLTTVQPARLADGRRRRRRRLDPRHVQRSRAEQGDAGRPRPRRRRRAAGPAADRARRSACAIPTAPPSTSTRPPSTRPSPRSRTPSALLVEFIRGTRQRRRRAWDVLFLLGQIGASESIRARWPLAHNIARASGLTAGWCVARHARRSPSRARRSRRSTSSGPSTCCAGRRRCRRTRPRPRTPGSRSATSSAIGIAVPRRSRSSRRSTSSPATATSRTCCRSPVRTS